MEVKRGYKQTEVGVIPDDWKTGTIRSVCKLINGRGFKPFEWRKDGLPIIRIQNLNGSEDYNYYQGSYDKKLEVEPGQLLFAWSGSRGTSFGPHIWSGTRGLLNYHTWKIQVFETEIDRHFFFHALRKLTAFIEDSAHGASALVHTQKWEMEGFELPLPPTTAEQEAIADALSDADALVESLEQLVAKKRQIKYCAMQELLTGKKRLSGIPTTSHFKQTDAGEIPEDWSVSTLGATCSFENGDRGENYPSSASFEPNGVPFINAGHVADGRIKLDELAYITRESFDLLGSGKFREGDILFCLRGSIGKYGIVTFEVGEGAIASSLIIVRPKTMNISREYLLCYFGSANCVRMIKKWAGGAAQPNLGAQDFARFSIPIPPTIDEQSAISAILSDMDADITALEAKLDKARQIKQGMMQELLTGRIRLV